MWQKRLENLSYSCNSNKHVFKSFGFQFNESYKRLSWKFWQTRENWCYLVANCTKFLTFNKKSDSCILNATYIYVKIFALVLFQSAWIFNWFESHQIQQFIETTIYLFHLSQPHYLSQNRVHSIKKNLKNQKLLSRRGFEI